MRLDRVVAGVDFSDPSISAVSWGTKHFAPDAEITLVYVAEVPRTPVFMEGLLPSRERIISTLQEGGRSRLEALARELGEERVRIEVHDGRPSDVLMAVAAERDADLIVVGEHGRHRRFGLLPGSTAERLVRRAPLPVLVARGLPDGAPRTVLLPVDESPVSERVLGWGRLLRDRFGAETIGLYAVSASLYGRVSVVSSVPRAHELEGRMLESARLWLADRLRNAGLAHGEDDMHVSFGDAGHEVNAAVERFDADLIVMGSRGAGSAGRLLLGSTAGTVLRRGTRSVLFLHHTQDQGGTGEND